jgi:galactokinase
VKNQGNRKQNISAKFMELYGSEPEHWVRAPGRAELLGTDTDDNEGYVLTMSIHLDAWIAFSPSGSANVRLYTMNLDKGTEFLIGKEPKEQSSDWHRYISGVAQILQQHGHQLEGVDAVIHSTVPLGGGLSSSASLEIAAALMFQEVSDLSLEPKQTAMICQKAENECVGVMCGILDQYTSIFGRRGTALLLDCRSLSHIEIWLPSDIQIVICDTNVPRTLAGSEYGKRRQECEEGARILGSLNAGVRTLRDVNSPFFESHKSSLPEIIRKRSRFIVEENQRVMDFTAAVVRNDWESMSRLCEGSFAGMRDLYEKTVPEMERMYEAMTSAPGAIAARQSGGGFGGCMIAYVEANQVDRFSAHVREVYKEKTSITPTVYAAEPADEAGVVKDL